MNNDIFIEQLLFKTLSHEVIHLEESLKVKGSLLKGAFVCVYKMSVDVNQLHIFSVRSTS